MLCTFSEYKADFHSVKCGGKGRTLAELFQLGFPVPQGFIIFPEAFDNQIIIDQAWSKIKKNYHYLETLGYSSVAVRSSSAAEDGVDASFAGEFESVLNVSGEADLQKAILQVYISRNNSRSRSYSQAKNIKLDNTFSIVIQGMIDADISGVLFTVDPVQGAQQTMSGNFVKGIGDKLMSGDIDPLVFVFNKSTKKYTGPACLESFSQRLYDMAIRLENHFSTPQDIEWAISDGNIHLLQSRPITAIYEPDPVYEEHCDNQYLWSNTNVGEAYSEVLTPLTWSIAKRDDINTKKMPANHPMLRLFFGRLYINLSIQLAILNKFGMKPSMAADELKSVFGSIPEEMTTTFIDISVADIVIMLLKNCCDGIVNAIIEKKFISQLKKNNTKKCREAIDFISNSQSTKEILDMFDEHTKEVNKTFEFLTINANRMVNKHRELNDLLATKTDEEDQVILSSGFNTQGGLESMGPLMGAIRLSKGEIDKAQFYEEYGHRCVNEFELASPRPYESENWIDKFLEESIALESTESRIEEMQQERQRAWLRLQATDIKTYTKSKGVYKQCARWAKSREMIRSELIRKIMVRRKIFLQLGKLTSLNDDVFFLTIEEIYNLIRQRDKSGIKKIENRKKIHTIYKSTTPPPYMIFGDYETTKKMNIQNTEIIKGLPGSSGIFEGYVRLLDNFGQIDQIEDGDILVTPSINVGWTMIFPKLGAIITDNGAPLSHGAIIARELGIPAVVSTGHGTSMLKTGDRVRVDGASGYVEKI